MKVLFVTWDGPQVSYLEGLFLPIFKRLQRAGLKFHVLQFTWGGAARVEVTRKACEAAGVTYRSAPVWRRPVGPGALLTAFAGARLIRKAAREWSIDVLMPRSNLPALACLLALRRLRLPMVFDADGLPLDERVDFGGQSPSAWAHRFLRDIEAQAVRRANIVLTRSEKASEILHARGGAGTAMQKFHVIGNGRDASQFRPLDGAALTEMRRSLELEPESPIVVYAGSLGGKYCARSIVDLFKLIARKNNSARLLVLSVSKDVAEAAIESAPEIRSRARVLHVPNEAVPRYLACADVGLSIIKPSYSMQAVSAIKTGEYLLCGVPVIGTAGIGDSEKICARAGFVLRDISDESLNSASDWFLNEVLPDRQKFRRLSREVGEDFYSLDATVCAYARALGGANL